MDIFDRIKGKIMGKNSEENANPEGKATKVDIEAEMSSQAGPSGERPKEEGSAEPIEFPAEDALEKKLAESEKNFLYLRAEFENYKRNAIKERAQLTKFGAERLARDLLDTLDVFAQAFENEITQENFENFAEGIKMTRQQLVSTLEKHGIQEVPSLGENFDPNNHEALGSEESENYSPGQVCRVFKAPYKYHDKLLRAGQVFVAREKEKKD